MTLKAQVKKATKEKWDFSKLKRFCTTKESINGIKRQPMEREKIFANHKSYEFNLQNKSELLQHNNKKWYSNFKNVLKTWTDIYSKKIHKMANSHIEKCSGWENFLYWFNSQQYYIVHLKFVKRKDLMLRILTIPKRIFYKNIQLGIINKMHHSTLNLTSVCNTNNERYISSLPVFTLSFISFFTSNMQRPKDIANFQYSN